MLHLLVVQRDRILNCFYHALTQGKDLISTWQGTVLADYMAKGLQAQQKYDI